MDRTRDAGRIIGSLCERNSELHRQLEEVRVGSGPEAVAVAEKRASELDTEVAHLNTELKAAKSASDNLQKLLRVEKLENRLRKMEASDLAAKLASKEAEAKTSSEVLAKEKHLRSERE
ncbi:unnamed protein product, partial [Musa textilis]